MDKGYYDYDFEAVDEKAKRKPLDTRIKSDAEVASMLSMFGWKPKTPEDMQRVAMSEIKGAKNTGNDK